MFFNISLILKCQTSIHKNNKKELMMWNHPAEKRGRTDYTLLTPTKPKIGSFFLDQENRYPVTPPPAISFTEFRSSKVCSALSCEDESGYESPPMTPKKHNLHRDIFIAHEHTSLLTCSAKALQPVASHQNFSSNPSIQSNVANDDIEFQQLLQEQIGVPFVGLINKITGEIVLGPCISQKVNLIYDSEDNSQIYRVNILDKKLNTKTILEAPEEISPYQMLLKKGYLPRKLSNDCGQFKSAHELLFEKRNLVHKAAWGGFAITLSSLPENKTIFTFGSGSFNTAHNEGRIQGAPLDLTSQQEVTSRIQRWLASHQ